MCVIIVKPAGIDIPETDLSDMWESNQDGMGVMWASAGKLRISKSLPKTAKAAVNTIKSLNLIGHLAVYHFRFATHGIKSIDNTHPFLVNSGLAMCHNGTLSGIDCGNGTDSEAYIAQHIKPLLNQSKDQHNTLTAMLPMIGAHIGASNKLVFLDRLGRVSIVNEKSGHTLKNGAWVSNLNWQGFDYKPIKKRSNPRWLDGCDKSDRQLFTDRMFSILGNHGVTRSDISLAYDDRGFSDSWAVYDMLLSNEIDHNQALTTIYGVEF